MSEIPGRIAKHAWVTDECRANRGDHGAGYEAAMRVLDEYLVCVSGWPPGTRFHFVLTVERPPVSNAANGVSDTNTAAASPAPAGGRKDA